MLGRALAQSRILASSIPVRTLLSARVVSRGSFVSIPSNVVVPSIMPRRFMANNSVKVPPLADSITSAVVLSVNKQVGDSVAIDESVVTLETDKVNIDVRSPVSGVIESILVKESDVVEVAQEIFVVKEGAAGSSAPKTAAAPAKTETPKAADTPAPKTDAPKADAPKAASAPAKTEAPKAAPASTAPAVKGSRTERIEKMSSMRNRIAERLKGSQNTYALLTTFQEADMSNLMALRDEYKDEFAKKHGTKLGFMSAFVKASTVALLDQPIVNSVIADGNIIYRDYVDISIAVATPKGLVTPVLRNCENMSFADIEKQILQYGDKAKKGQITLEDLAGGTFTISNGGVYGSLMGTPIVNPPQSAILGMHAINKKAVVVNDQIVIRPIMVLALTYDHRLIDGRDAVTFLRKIKSVIEDPRRILLDL